MENNKELTTLMWSSEKDKASESITIMSKPGKGNTVGDVNCCCCTSKIEIPSIFTKLICS